VSEQRATSSQRAEPADNGQGPPLAPAPVASPMAPTIDALVTELRSYLHLEDTGHVWFTLAVALSAELDGHPLWGQLVGASSGGKTEAIRLLDNVAEHVDELTGPSLLSWTKGKVPKSTGILVRIGSRGLITVSDFSTVLAMSDHGTRDVLFSLLRRVADGEVHRDLGNAPSALAWHGRATFMAACTPAIDNYSAHAQQLGERWLYWRLPPQPTKVKRAASAKARENGAGIDVHRARARAMATAIVRQAGRQIRGVQLPTELSDALDDAAIVTCYGRAAVPRTGYGRREITGEATVEEPPRLTGHLSMLAQGLLALGMGPDDVLRMCRRSALDSMPAIRRKVLAFLASREQATVSEVARHCRCDRKVARFALEELAAIGVAMTPGFYDDDQGIPGARFNPSPWSLDGDDADLIRDVVTAPIWHEQAVFPASRGWSGEQAVPPWDEK
jgi:hypothetical protein